MACIKYNKLLLWLEIQYSQIENPCLLVIDLGSNFEHANLSSSRIDMFGILQYFPEAIFS